MNLGLDWVNLGVEFGLIELNRGNGHGMWWIGLNGLNLVELGWIKWINELDELDEWVKLDEIVELEDDKHFVTELVTCV